MVVLFLLLLLARRRKAQQEAEKHLRMARDLAEEQAFSAELDLPKGIFEDLEVPPPSVKLATAPTPTPPPAPAPAPAPGNCSGCGNAADRRAIGFACCRAR